MRAFRVDGQACRGSYRGVPPATSLYAKTGPGGFSNLRQHSPMPAPIVVPFRHRPHNLAQRRGGRGLWSRSESLMSPS